MDMPESEDEIRRRVQIEAHERYLIGKRIARGALRDGCLLVFFAIALLFALILLAPHLLGWV
jgi:hypothetical protein